MKYPTVLIIASIQENRPKMSGDELRVSSKVVRYLVVLNGVRKEINEKAIKSIANAVSAQMASGSVRDSDKRERYRLAAESVLTKAFSTVEVAEAKDEITVDRDTQTVTINRGTKFGGLKRRDLGRPKQPSPRTGDIEPEGEQPDTSGDAAERRGDDAASEDKKILGMKPLTIGLIAAGVVVIGIIGFVVFRKK